MLTEDQAVLKAKDLQSMLEEHFMRYVRISSQSKSGTEQVPSSPGQRELAELLKEDLTRLGLVDISLSDHSVLIGHLPSNTDKDLPVIGFVAHLDTVDVNLNPQINAHKVHYTGGDLCQNEKEGIYISHADHPELDKYVGQDILVSDGHSVLGADDKAAISSIMTALTYWKNNPHICHGDIYVAFVPDEEIGLVGAKHMDFTKFPVDFAYTLDCCEIGEVVYQTFNAGSAHVHIQGISAHPMSAKGVLLNPTLVAVDFVQLFNRLETPENTDGTDGYIWVQSIESNQSTATITLNIRDHHKDRYEAKKTYIKEAVSFIKKRYPRAKISVDIEDVYSNINDAITEENRFCIDYIYKAMDFLGIEPITLAMRGGTDGSFISTKGIPTPNFFTGAHNFHSSAEFLPMKSFEMSCRMILTIVDLIVQNDR